MERVLYILKQSKLVVGLTKGFLRGKALSVEGHAHSASNITSGTLPVTRGGTGATSAAAARSALGAAATSHTHDDRYYTESEVNSKIQGVENMIQITMGGVRLVGSGNIYKTFQLKIHGTGPFYENSWQIGASGLPNGDFMRIVTFPFSDGYVTGNFNEYIVLKSSLENYAIIVQTDIVNRKNVWYKNDNSIMIRIATTTTSTGVTDSSFSAYFSYEIYKYQS